MKGPLGAARQLCGPLGRTPPNLAWWLASGITPLAAYQAKGAATYVASLVNLVTPGTYDLTEGNSTVTWDAVNGWQFTIAAAKYLNTNLVPASGYSMLIQFSNHTPNGTMMLCGEFKSATTSRFNLGTDSVPAGGLCYYGSGASVAVAPSLTAGNLAVAGQQGYRDGVADGAAIGAWAGTTTFSIFIGARNLNGSPSQFSTNNTKAFIVFSSTLTAPQVALQVAAMAAL